MSAFCYSSLRHHVPHAVAPEHGSADAMRLAWKRHLLKATNVIESISNVRPLPSLMQSRTSTSGQDMSHAAQEKSTLVNEGHARHSRVPA